MSAIEGEYGALRLARRIGVAMLLLGLCGAAVAKLWAPHLIEQAWYGHSIPFLNHLMAARHERASLQHDLQRWSEVTTTALVLWLLLAGVLPVLSSAGFYRRFVGPASPQALGAIRILVCAVVLICVLWEDLPSGALLPPEMRDPMGFLQLLYRLPIHFDALVSSSAGLRALQWTTILLLIAALIGWRTRVVLPLAACGWFLIGGICRQYDHFYHTGLLPLHLLAVLSFTPCADGLSLDRRRRMARGLAVADAGVPLPVYGWSRYACWITVALAYLLAGLSKLRSGGPLWWNAMSMRAYIFNDTMEPRSFHSNLALHLTRAPDLVFALLGFTALASEMVFALVLFSALARKILPVMVALMHLGILFLQNILFFDFIVLQLIFVDYDRVRAWWRRAPSVSPTRAPGTRTAAAPRRAVFAPILVCGLVPVLTAAWACRREVYPFTGWPMYADPPESLRVQFLQLMAHHRSGAVARAAPDATIGALADGRYRRILWDTYSPERGDAGRKFLAIYAAAFNRKAGADKITAFELQRWEWDFETHPNGPQEARQTGDLWLNVDD